MDNLEAQEKMNAILQMRDTDGWKLVESYIKGRMEAIREQLLTCHIDEVEKLRAAYKAYGLVICHCDDLIERGQGIQF